MTFYFNQLSSVFNNCDYVLRIRYYNALRTKEKWGNSDYRRDAPVIERETDNSADIYQCTLVRSTINSSQ